MQVCGCLPLQHHHRRRRSELPRERELRIPLSLPAVPAHRRLETDVAFIVYSSTDPTSRCGRRIRDVPDLVHGPTVLRQPFLALPLLTAKAEDHLRFQEMAGHLVAQRASESHRRCGSVLTRISARTRPLGLPTTHTCKPPRLSWFPRWHLLANRVGTTHADLECACTGLSLERW